MGNEIVEEQKKNADGTVTFVKKIKEAFGKETLEEKTDNNGTITIIKKVLDSKGKEEIVMKKIINEDGTVQII